MSYPVTWRACMGGSQDEWGAVRVRSAYAAVVICGLDPCIHLALIEAFFKEDGSPGQARRRRIFGVLFVGRPKISPEFGWIATISKPRFRVSIKLKPWGEKIGASHDRPLFCA